MKKLLLIALVLLLICGSSSATTLDVYDWDTTTNTGVIIGQIDTIATSGTGTSHYDYFSSSGHPYNVNLGYYNSSVWVHENTGTNEYTFGFIFGIDNGPNDPNEATLDFKIVDSTSNVYVSQSDDPGEAIETSPGEFDGDFWYNQNTDGVAVSGITGSTWTIMIQSLDLGNITNWYAASGETADFSDDLQLTLGHQYRITLEGNDPSDEFINTIPEPTTILLFGFGLLGIAGTRRRIK